MFRLYHLINTKKTPYIKRHERDRRQIFLVLTDFVVRACVLPLRPHLTGYAASCHDTESRCAPQRASAGPHPFAPARCTGESSTARPSPAPPTFPTRVSHASSASRTTRGPDSPSADQSHWSCEPPLDNHKPP